MGAEEPNRKGSRKRRAEKRAKRDSGGVDEEDKLGAVYDDFGGVASKSLSAESHSSSSSGNHRRRAQPWQQQQQRDEIYASEATAPEQSPTSSFGSADHKLAAPPTTPSALRRGQSGGGGADATTQFGQQRARRRRSSGNLTGAEQMHSAAEPQPLEETQQRARNALSETAAQAEAEAAAQQHVKRHCQSRRNAVPSTASGRRVLVSAANSAVVGAAAKAKAMAAPTTATQTAKAAAAKIANSLQHTHRRLQTTSARSSLSFPIKQPQSQQQQQHHHHHHLTNNKTATKLTSAQYQHHHRRAIHPSGQTQTNPAHLSTTKSNDSTNLNASPILQTNRFSTTILTPSSSATTMADQAVIDKLEAGFAKLQASTPEQCHSLLKKYLTRDVLDQLKTKKTAMGASLLDVAQSGFENLDSGVGIYAPDAESYTLFGGLFNPIIEDYHGGFKATDKHPASDFGDLETLVNVDPDNQFVISTRVRCGRSLKGYPFNPCLTEDQYKEMESKVSGTLKELDGDLAGKYYPLTGMTKETQQQLIDDHFLFKEGDRFLQAANACRYWPTGRGIYHNDSKTFLVWVNEEDHLRIISMQKGGDLKQVFGRLVKGARAIEAKVPFSRDDRLGFLTFCPTNLGTTIRASVHIKLPKLAADRKKLEEVAGKYNLQVRGTSGEHTESVGGVYDISNKRRLGLTEYQAVREMQDGILELIKIEKSL